MQTVVLYKVKCNGKTFAAFLDRRSAELYAKEDFPEVFGHVFENAMTEIVESTESVVEVNGERLRNCDPPHVLWRCPYCNEDHYTDLEPDETSPAFWGCELKGMDCACLVRFE